MDIGTYKLQSSDIVKFLGVWIDKKLTWNKHISTLIVKLKQNLHLLKMSKTFLKKETKKLIYYALIYSHLTYGILIWGTMISHSILNKIQKIMNTSFNLITGLTPTPENFKKEKMIRLQDLIQLENKKLGYQLERKLLPSNLYNLLWTDSKNKTLQKTHHYNTRDKHLPKLPKVNTNNYHQGFQFQSIKDYESTPVEIRTLYSFTRKLKLHLISPN